MARAGSAKSETHVVEWQESWRDDCLRWLCGFATVDDGCAVTSESWPPYPTGGGPKDGLSRALWEGYGENVVLIIACRSAPPNKARSAMRPPARLTHRPPPFPLSRPRASRWLSGHPGP